MSGKIEHIKGDTFEAEVSVKNKVGAAVSLSGAAVSWKVAESRDAAAPILTKTIGEGIAITDETGGKLTLTLTAAETAALEPGEYFHALRISFADGRVKTVLAEYLSIIESL